MAEQVPWVELRIHGVSGTPPEDMLGSPHVRQVAGDEFSRFFRAVDAQHEEVRPEPDHILEGYHWGKFTSGSWRQGLWLVILPFGVVNAAQFMLPAPPKTSKAAKVWHAICGAMLRLLGLALTATLLLGTAVVAMDLTAWQWGPQQNLPEWADMPGWPLAAGMLLCVAVLGLLFSFGRRLGGANHDAAAQDGRAPGIADVAPRGNPERGRDGGDVPDTDLRLRRFFLGDTDAPALRNLHLAAGLLLIAALGAATGKPFDGGSAAVVWSFWISIGLAGLVTLIVILLGDPERSVTVETEPEGRAEDLRLWWHGVVPVLSRVLVFAAIACLVVSVILSGLRSLPDRTSPPKALPGIDGAAFVLLMAAVIAIVALLAANGFLAMITRTRGDSAPPRKFGRFAMGMASALAASVGTFLAVGYAAALPFGWAWFLGRGDGPKYETSPLLQRIAYSWGLTFLVIVILLIAAGISYLSRHSEFLDRAAAAFTFGVGPVPSLRLPDRWIGRVATRMWMARLKNSVQLLFWVFALFGLLLSVAAGTEFLASRNLGEGESFDLPGPLGSLSEVPSVDGAGVVIALGTVVLIGLAAGLVFLGRGAIRKESLRRAVNVAWDVIAFWPRAVHPFVPPPYSQRTVADLHDRICWHLDHPVSTLDGRSYIPERPAKHVIVAAHSQGSLIALAALLWLDAEQRKRVGLVTFGSQLKVAFPRAFPAYVNFPLLRWLYLELDERWVSLYRDTDPIGGPVLSWDRSPDSFGATPHSYRIGEPKESRLDTIDPMSGRRICGREWRLLDPSPYDIALQEGAVFKIRAHSNYPDDPAWPNALAAAAPLETPLETALETPPSVGPQHAAPSEDVADTRAIERTRPIDPDTCATGTDTRAIETVAINPG